MGPSCSFWYQTFAGRPFADRLALAELKLEKAMELALVWVWEPSNPAWYL